MGIFRLNDRVIQSNEWPWGCRAKVGLVEKGACDVSPTPVYTAYCADVGVPGGHVGGWNLDEVNTYARYTTDSSGWWAKIDFGQAYYVDSVRFRMGTNSGVTCYLRDSLNDADWTLIATYTGLTYYSEISPWIPVKRWVRYFKYTRDTKNYIRLIYFGVKALG